MEALDVEAAAQTLLGVLAQTHPSGVADLVAGRLTRPDAVAFDLGGDARFLVAQGVDHVADALLAAPALVVKAGIHDQARGPERPRLQIAHLAAATALTAPGPVRPL